VWEATATMKATHVAVVLVAETSTQEDTLAWDSTTLRVKDAEDRTALVEREAWERALRIEAENAATLAFAHEDAEGLVWKITLLEGELTDERRAHELAKENSHCLFDAAADVKRQWEVFERER
jgi:hypothetical protein